VSLVTRPILLLATCVALLGACRGEPPAAEAPAADTLRTGEHAALSDAEVLHALIAATEIGAATAARALEQAQHIDVEMYSHVVRADHSALQREFASLAANLGLQPAENEVSRHLQIEGTQALARIDNVEPEAFDRAFVDAEIQFYQTFVDTYDARLMPSARQPQLRDVMRAAKPTFEAHLQRAAQLRAQLAGVQPGETAPGTAPQPGQPQPPAAAQAGQAPPAAPQPAPQQPAPPPAPPDTTPRPVPPDTTPRPAPPDTTPRLAR
jgi:putative membrane protein